MAFLGYTNIGKKLIGRPAINQNHSYFSESLNEPIYQITGAIHHIPIDRPIDFTDKDGNRLHMETPCDRYEYHGSIEALMKRLKTDYESTIKFLHKHKLILIVKVIQGYGTITFESNQFQTDMTVVLSYIKTTRKSFLHPIELKYVDVVAV